MPSSAQSVKRQASCDSKRGQRTSLGAGLVLLLGLLAAGCQAAPATTTSAQPAPTALLQGNAAPVAAAPSLVPLTAAPPSAVPTASAPTAVAPTLPPPTIVPSAAAPATALPTLLPTAQPTATAAQPASMQASRDIGYVPILMYHYIRTVDEKQDPLGFRLSVIPANFEQQLEWIKQQGYTPIGMTALAKCLRDEQPCPEKPVVLTFDDGYDDAATAALPALQRYGFTATFYIVPNFVGTPNYMTWEQVRALQQAGMEIGSHTMSHADLTAVSAERARNEIVESRAVLEQALGKPVLSFCYPAGKNSDALALVVRDAGYTSAVTTSPTGGFANMFQLARRRVLGGESVKGFPWYFQPVQPTS